MKRNWLAVALVSWIAMAAEPPAVFNPVSYGAKGDGRTNDGAAIQRGIDACTMAWGGTVYLPPSNLLTGTVVLRNNVTLYFIALSVRPDGRDLTRRSP